MNKQSNEHNKGIFKIFGMMGICCILPILISIILPFVGGSIAASRISGFIAPLICPIIMVTMFMIMSKNGKKHSCCSKDSRIKE